MSISLFFLLKFKDGAAQIEKYNIKIGPSASLSIMLLKEHLSAA